MSGPATHYIVGKKLPAALQARVDILNSGTAANGLLQNSPYLNLGTMGPDFLFFNTNDMPAPVKIVADLSMDVAEFIDDFKAKLLAIVPEPIVELKEQLDEAIEGTIEHSTILTELQQTVGDVQSLIDALLASAQLKITEHITDAVNVFDLLEHPIQAGHGQSKW